jgi:hypothetical protein
MSNGLDRIEKNLMKLKKKTVLLRFVFPGQIPVAHSYNPSCLGVAMGLRWGGLRFEASLGKQFTRPISKITRAKWTGGVAQAAECLLCKCLLSHTGT